MKRASGASHNEIILAIDPGLLRTGYACLRVDSQSRTRILEAGVLRLTARLSVAQRLKELDDDLSQIIDEHSPTRMAVEQVFAHTAHLRTAIIMAHARGVVLLAAARAKLPVFEYAPASVKSAVAGTGQATKRQMQLAVMAQCGLSAMPSPPDVADAIAIGLTDARRISPSRR